MEDPSSAWIAFCIMAVTMVMKVSIGLYSYMKINALQDLNYSGSGGVTLSLVGS